MKGKNPNPDELSLFQTQLSNLLNPEHDLYRLREIMNWKFFEEKFSNLYHQTGRPAKPVQVMIGLLILKQMYQLSDEEVCKRWVQNPYWQYFCGETFFQWHLSCDPSDLVYFRKRIGEEGVLAIFENSVKLHGKDAYEKEVVADTTVMEKNITYPTDTKLRIKMIKRIIKIAGEEGYKIRQKYPRVLKKCILDLRFKKHAKNQGKGKKAEKKIKIIAGRLIREMERIVKEKKEEKYDELLELFKKVLKQKKNDKKKIYSLHEPGVSCISKGKEHKKYEFGTKASIIRTKTTGVIVGALNAKNEYDGNTVEPAMEQVEKILGVKPKRLIGDRGYRGKKEREGVMVMTPGVPKKSDTNYEKQKNRERFRRRAAIEPVIGHLKFDYGLKRCYLKGEMGDQINILMACAVYNIKSFLKKTRTRVKCFFEKLFFLKKWVFQG